MIDDGGRAKRSLQRIADALGVNPTLFHTGAGEPQAAHEALELLTAFERISDAKDRRSCLDYVKAVAARRTQAAAQ